MDENIDSKKPELFVVDGTNVCYWWGHAFKHRDTGMDKISVRPLLVLLCEIREHGDDFYCIFDASITNLIKQHGQPKEAGLIGHFLRCYSRWFYRVTGSTQADSAILHYASKFNSRIITNDIYRDYHDKIPWLNDKHTTHLIQGNFQRTGLMTVEKLSYGFMEVEWTALTRDLIQRIYNCLAEDFNWKAYQDVRRVQPKESDVAPVIETAKVVEASRAFYKEKPSIKVKRQKTAAKTVQGSPNGTPTKKTAKTTKKAPISKATVTKSRGAKKAATKTTPKSQKVRRRKNPPKKKGFLDWLFG